MKITDLKPKDYIGLLCVVYEKVGIKQDAEYMFRYMKGHSKFFGLKSPLRKGVTRSFFENNGIAPVDNWQAYVKESWKKEHREIQLFGQELCLRYKKHYAINDINLFEYMITTKSWWDSVDYIASNIIGTYFWKYPEQIRPVIDKWKHSENMWLVRTAILFQLKYKDHTDFKLLQEVIHLHKFSKEFFIQKAIGWSLRQYAKTAPNDVLAFVTETELKPLSRREALKHIGD